jgi:hypothetical protein
MASSLSTGIKAVKESIVVSKEQPPGGKSKDDLTGFTPSDRTPRTPPQQSARPALPPGGPSKPTHRPRKSMTPFDTEDDDPNKGEEVVSPTDTETTIDDILKAIQGLRETREELDKMKTSGQNLTIKANALRAMNNVIQLEGSIQRMKKDEHQAKSPPQSHPSETDRIANIEKSIRELKAGQAAIHEAVTTKPKAWTSMAGPTPKRTSTTMPNDPDHGQTERLDKFRMERAKTEVKLLTRNTTDEMKKQLAGMTETDLVKILSTHPDAKYVESENWRIMDSKYAAEQKKKLKYCVMFHGRMQSKEQQYSRIHSELW